MTPEPAHRPSDRSLPLAEPAAGHSCAGPAEVTEAQIRMLVDSFYQSAQGDEVIGPIFVRRVRDWSVHLQRMYDFWSTLVLQSGRYSGRPIEAHEAIGELSAEHVARWLRIWEATVERVIPERARDSFITAARRMARSMGARLEAKG